MLPGNRFIEAPLVPRTPIGVQISACAWAPIGTDSSMPVLKRSEFRWLNPAEMARDAHSRQQRA